MPAIILSSVVFPEPFGPISPNDWPGSMSKLTPRSAQKSSARAREEIRRALSDDGFSRYSRNFLLTSAISTEVVLISELLREVARHAEEQTPGQVQEAGGEHADSDEQDGDPGDAFVQEDLLRSPAHDRRDDAVERPLEAVHDVRERVEQVDVEQADP